MNLLAFDTSTDTLSIAVQRGEVVWQQQLAGGAQSSVTLIPGILQGLDALGLVLAGLDAIVFGRGPGAFTGLRTACAVAQGLALGAGVRVLPVDTLLAVAEEARVQYGLTELAAVLDARMHEVYHAAYCWDAVEGCWCTTQPLGLCAPEALELPPGLPIAGNAHVVYPGLAPQHSHYPALPTATALLRLAPALIAQGGLVQPEQAMPLYQRDKVALTMAERTTVVDAVATS